MTRQEAQELFAYGSWANARFLAAARALSRDQLEREATASFPSVIGTLGHIVGAEWVWLRRWLGQSPAAMPDWVARPELETLSATLAMVEAERRAWLVSLADGDLGRVVPYRTFAGQSSSDTLAHLVRHVVNHSTYHRGQLAAQLRQLGQTPPSTDFVRFLREPAAT